MKNTHILSLQEEVPIEIRKQVYQEALLICQSNDIRRSYGLCLLLPTLLWDMNHHTDVGPNGKRFKWRDTTTAFPETKNLVAKLLKVNNENDAIIARIEGLKVILAKMG